MKKISVGAFPLINLHKDERIMMEKYLINNLSDLITLNQVSQSISNDREKFITPTSILQFMKDNKNIQIPENMAEGASADIRVEKAKTISRAFKNTKDLYRAISNDPFYKGNYFYPIYIEEPILQGKYQDFKYDFLLLSNDLIKKQILDEVTFDDRVTLLFLILKVQLFPYLKLDQLGVGNDFRKHFSVFLETCKNNDINPIDMIIKIIKFAGRQKSNGKGQSIRTLFNKVTARNGNSQYHSPDFLSLFDKAGQIADVDMLINFTQRDISAYLDDEIQPTINANNNLFNRQYTQAKTHEYAKILSIIDALTFFNKSQNMVTDVNTESIAQKIKVIQNKETFETQDIYINHDHILSDLETTYFKNFMTRLMKADEYVVKRFFNLSKLQSVFADRSVSRQPEIILGEYNIAKREYDALAKKQSELDNEIRLHGHTYTPDVLNSINVEMNNTANLLSNAQSNVSRLQNEYTNAIGMSRFSSVTENKQTEDFQSFYKINLDEIQSYLTSLYAVLYSYFYSDEFKEDLAEGKNLTYDDFKRLDIYKGHLYFEITEISNLYLRKYKDAIFNDIKTGVLKQYDGSKNNNEPSKDYIEQLMATGANFLSPNNEQQVTRSAEGNLNIAFNEKMSVESLSKEIFDEIINPVFKKYTNTKINEASKVKDLRIQKNPLLKRLFSNDNIFKSFILTKEIMLQCYEVLHYLDTLKYTEGLINSPVSKVFDEQNKIAFLINRLGLADYPIFILDKANIILSLPAHLSMTNTRLLSKVTFQQFQQIVNINYDKMWQSDNMFGGFGKNKKNNEEKNKKLNESIKKLEAEIKIKADAIKKEKDEKKKQILIKAKINLEKEKQKHQQTIKDNNNSTNQYRNIDYGSVPANTNFSSNLDIRKRDGYIPQVSSNNRNDNRQFPRVGTERHQDDQQNSNNRINNSMNQVDTLRHQSSQDLSRQRNDNIFRNQNIIQRQNDLRNQHRR